LRQTKASCHCGHRKRGLGACRQDGERDAHSDFSGPLMVFSSLHHAAWSRLRQPVGHRDSAKKRLPVLMSNRRAGPPAQPLEVHPQMLHLSPASCVWEATGSESFWNQNGGLLSNSLVAHVVLSARSAPNRENPVSVSCRMRFSAGTVTRKSEGTSHRNPIEIEPVWDSPTVWARNIRRTFFPVLAAD
jgi:hypothetical protein